MAWPKRQKKKIIDFSPLELKDGFRIIARNKWNMLRSGLIGISVGIIPGVGEDVAGWLSYWAAKAASKTKDMFGKGATEGIIAAETGNNACIGGAIIPVLSLAIPGSAPAAVLLAALWLHDLHPGPLLMEETPAVVYSLSVYMTASAFVMWVLGLLISRVSVRILSIDKRLLMPVVYMLCVIGAFVIDNKVFDVYLVFWFGLLGVVLRLTECPSTPFLLGIILGPMADNSLRRALLLSSGSLAPFIKRPISLVFVIAISALALSQLPISYRSILGRFTRRGND